MCELTTKKKELKRKQELISGVCQPKFGTASSVISKQTVDFGWSKYTKSLTATTAFGQKLTTACLMLIFANIWVFPLKAEIVEASFYTKASAMREGTSGVFTANGERFNEAAQTCAHPSKPFGTLLKVTNLKTGTWFECRVNDRGPAMFLVKRGRKLDMTPKGFDLLGLDRRVGVARVKVQEVRA